MQLQRQMQVPVLLAAIILLCSTLILTGREIHVNVNAAWPSSEAYSLLELGELVADENELLFWKWIDILGDGSDLKGYLDSNHVAENKKASASSTEEMTSVYLESYALHSVNKLLSANNNIAELILASRAYSPKVEYIRQLALDSKYYVQCDAEVEVWAVLRRGSTCSVAACSFKELKELLSNVDTIAKKKCFAASQSDVRLDKDHVYKPEVARQVDQADLTIIVYGMSGTKALYDMHQLLRERVLKDDFIYILRPYSPESKMPTPLQGYGVSLDIKDMEYNTLDDVEADTTADGSDEDKMPSANSISEDAIENHTDIQAKHFRNLGSSATSAILNAADPLIELQTLSQNFPRFAKKLAGSKKLLDRKVRSLLQQWQNDISPFGFGGTLAINGIVVSVHDDSFNAFDFLRLLHLEWSLSQKFAALNYDKKQIRRLQKIGMHIPGDASSELSSDPIRIFVRESGNTNTVMYLNDVETDPVFAHLPQNLNALLRPSWNFIFLARNLYDYTIVFDPTTTVGMAALRDMTSFWLNNIPIQIGLLITSKLWINAADAKERELLIRSWKAALYTSPATAWHFSKILILIKDKSTVRNQFMASMLSTVTSLEEEITINRLAKLYLEVTQGKYENEDKLKSILFGDELDKRVLAMFNFASSRHLPLPCSLFNGILHAEPTIHDHLSNLIGLEQALYQSLLRNGELIPEEDLVAQILRYKNAYVSYFPIYTTRKSTLGFHNFMFKAGKELSVFGNDYDGAVEKAFRNDISYLHSVDSGNIIKKETLIFIIDVAHPIECGHVYQGFQLLLGSQSKTTLRIVILQQPKLKMSDADEDRQSVRNLIFALLARIGSTDEKLYLQLISKVLECQMKKLSFEDTKQSLLAMLQDVKEVNLIALLESHDLKDLGEHELARQVDISRLILSRTAECAKLDGNDADSGSSPRLYINGQCMSLPRQQLSDRDLDDLIEFDLKTRTDAVARILINPRRKTQDMQESDAKSLEFMKACDLVGQNQQWGRVNVLHPLSDSTYKKNAMVHLDGDKTLHVVAILDPLSQASQRASSLLSILRAYLNAELTLVLLPKDKYDELPLSRFYRFVLGGAQAQNQIELNKASFYSLPTTPVFTMNLDTVEEWNVQIQSSTFDLDNIREDSKVTRSTPDDTNIVFFLSSILVYGQCVDVTSSQAVPPNGLQLSLDRSVGDVQFHRDTLVMQNYGYFQLQATPGVWFLQLAKGKASALFELASNTADPDKTTAASMPVLVHNFNTQLTNLSVRKRAGKENTALMDLNDDDDEESFDNMSNFMLGEYWRKFVQFMQYQQRRASKAVSMISADGRLDTIHVFSLATGQLYERFLKIMMLSVVKRTKNPVVFWLLENFLSPAFKRSIPALKAEFGIDVRFVTYKWPRWLRRQTVKQRIIWGYKILFLDVLFPLHVNRIIYVDSDQVVRADLVELWEMDLHGAPYAYTPFCDSKNKELQFWRQGYWRSHLQGRPYHISALYVVDLKLFRRMAAGDKLRAIYHELSGDPASLANLDQDLPNYAQHRIPIFSLPQEWLWCSSWCSDETKAGAKTIDLCNNPKNKEPKLEMAKRVISGDLFQESWIQLDQEIRHTESTHFESLSVDKDEL